MPALSPTMSQGNIIEWKVTEGQEIAPGDDLAEVETDKATITWENQDEGFVAKLLYPAGAQGIEVGAPVAILVEDADQVPAFKDYSAPSSGAPAAGSATEAAPAVETTAPSSGGATAPSYEVDSRLGPAARHYLEENHIAVTSVKPSGPHHMVTKGDVLAAIEAGITPASSEAPKPAAAAAAAAPPAPAQQAPKAPSAASAPTSKPAPAPAAPGAAYTDIPTTQIRRIIAQRLLESKSTIPHLYLSADVELDGIAQLREALKSQGLKISVNDCVIKAVALALAEVPAANAKWDVKEESIVSSPSVDISIAVATEGGLITPIVKNADSKSLAAISAEVKELAGRARENKLKPEEFQGGSFSISNLGMFGIDSFSAIINPPQACIMAVGGARKVARLVNGDPRVATVMTVTLSADNRVYDGQVASSVLEAFSKNMANPFRLMA